MSHKKHNAVPATQRLVNDECETDTQPLEEEEDAESSTEEWRYHLALLRAAARLVSNLQSLAIDGKSFDDVCPGLEHAKLFFTIQRWNRRLEKEMDDESTDEVD